MLRSNNIPGGPSPYGDLWKTLGCRGGPKTAQKWPKISPKNLSQEKFLKNEWNSQIRSIFWLIPQSEHRTRGLSPHGDLWGLWATGGGPETAKTRQKRYFKGKQKYKN